MCAKTYSMMNKSTSTHTVANTERYKKNTKKLAQTEIKRPGPCPKTSLTEENMPTNVQIIRKSNQTQTEIKKITLTFSTKTNIFLVWESQKQTPP